MSPEICEPKPSGTETTVVEHAAITDRHIAEELKAQEALIGDLEQRARTRRILSTLPYPKVPFWMENVESVFPRPSALWKRLKYPLGLSDPSLILRLLTRAHRYDVVFIDGGERADLVYLALAGISRWIRTPHVVVSAHWQRSAWPLSVLQRLIFRLGARLTLQVQPFSAEEVEIYHRHFGVPREKFRPIPFSTSIIGYSLRPTRGDYVITGGISFRDYPTFLRAVRTMDVPVEIGLPRGKRLPDADLTEGAPHITIHTTLTNRQYMDKVAGCRVMAMPITPRLERSTADQTILNAMHMGKIVIATDSIGPRNYIRDGENGFLVPEGDVEAWRDAIRRVYAMSDDEYTRISSVAAYDARVRFNERLRIYRVMNAGLDALDAHLRT